MKVFYLLSSILLFGLAGRTQVETLPYSQDFEGSTFLPTDWEAFGSNTNAAWEHSTSVGAYDASSSCAFFDNFNNNLTGNYYGMRAVRLDLTGAIEPKMRFDYAYARRSTVNSDILGIWYSFNGTTGWTNLHSFQDGSLITTTDQATYFTPTATEWDSMTLDLSAFAGEPLIRFAFENNCANGNVLYIDNVRFYDEATVGLNEQTRPESRFQLFPNPASAGQVTISAGTALLEIRITDGLGRTIQTLKKTSNQQAVFDVNTSSLRDGLYHVQGYDENGLVMSRKLIIQ